MEDDQYDDSETTEQNVYKKKTREELVENDEISIEEEGFMAGYESDEEDDEDEPEV